MSDSEQTPVPQPNVDQQELKFEEPQKTERAFVQSLNLNPHKTSLSSLHEGNHSNTHSHLPKLFSFASSRNVSLNIHLPTMKSVRDFFKAPNHVKTAGSLQNDPFYTIDSTKHCKIMRGYIRQDWDTINVHHGSEELRAGWIDILFDLIFVACVVHISSEAVYSIPSDESHRRLASSGSTAHEEDVYIGCDSGKYDFVLSCFAQFGLLSLFWMEQTMIDTHFVFNQQMDEIMELFYMIFVLSSGLFIRNDALYHVAFQVAYICLRVVSTLIYLKAFLIPRAKLHSLWNITINFVVIAGLSAVAIKFRGCPMDYFMIYSIFFLFEYASFITHWCIHNKEGQLIFALALHVAHISERFGLFVMLILGEAIISVVTSEVYGSFSLYGVLHIIFVVCTFVMTFCIAKLYFDCQPTEEDVMHGTHNHALRTTIKARIVYIISHHILFFGLLGFGIGAKMAFKHLNFESDYHPPLIDLLLPGYSLVVIVISLNVIRLSHPYKMASYLVWVFRVLLILIMAIAPLFVNKIDHSILFLVVLLCLILLNLVDVEGKNQRNKLKRELKEKREKEKDKALHIGAKNVRGVDLTDLHGLHQVDLDSIPDASPESY